VKLRVAAQKTARRPCILPRNASLPRFKEAVNRLVNLNMFLRSPDAINDAVDLFARNIHIAAESSTSRLSPSSPPQAPLKREIMDLVRLKRSLRRRYMRSQDPVDKSAYRRAEDDLKKLHYETKRKYFDEMLLNADPTKPQGFNLWKCIRNKKRQPLRKIPIKKSDDTWCRSDSEISLAFADEPRGC